MLMKRLKEYAERVGDEIPPSGYDKTAIKWIISLDAQDHPGEFIPTVGRGGKNDRGKEYIAPHRGRTSTAIRPKLLADNAEYVLGVSKNESISEKKQKRVNECHKAFVELVQQCAHETGEP